ncbi:hypothetical protein [Streptomyces humicola]|nr:hypothetical protein [Streptomyces humicola]
MDSRCIRHQRDERHPDTIVEIQQYQPTASLVAEFARAGAGR